MDEPFDSEFDPAGDAERTIGRGLFDEEMGPGSAMAHLYGVRSTG